MGKMGTVQVLTHQLLTNSKVCSLNQHYGNRDHEDYEELVSRPSRDLSRLIDHWQGLQRPLDSGI